jgi:hypothetical protein
MHVGRPIPVRLYLIPIHKPRFPCKNALYPRMHAQICEFPSKTLYRSKLKSHESVAPHLLRDLPNAKAESEEDAKELLGTPVVFYDTAGCEYFERLDGDNDEGSRCNENEVTVVKNWVEKLVRDVSAVRRSSPINKLSDRVRYPPISDSCDNPVRLGHHVCSQKSHLSQVSGASDSTDVHLATNPRTVSRNWDSRRNAGSRERRYRDQSCSKQ